MAIVVQEIWDGETSSGKWDTGREYTKIFRVTSDHMSDDGIVASAAVGIDYYDEYVNTLSGTSDIFAHCDSITITKDGAAKSGRVQLVNCHFTTNFPFKEAAGGAPGSTPADPASRDKNPSARPAVWTFDSININKARMFDFAGKPLVNSSNQYLTPPYEEQVSLLNIKVTKSYSTSALSLSTFTAFRNKCNDAPWHGLATNTVKVENVSAQQAALENGYPYFSVTWSFIVDDYPHSDGSFGWKNREILNAGTVGWSVAQGNTSADLEQLMDKGIPISAPVMLDLTSQRIDIGGSPVYLLFELCLEVDFTTIPGI